MTIKSRFRSCNEHRSRSRAFYQLSSNLVHTFLSAIDWTSYFTPILRFAFPKNDLIFWTPMIRVVLGNKIIFPFDIWYYVWPNFRFIAHLVLYIYKRICFLTVNITYVSLYRRASMILIFGTRPLYIITKSGFFLNMSFHVLKL